MNVGKAARDLHSLQHPDLPVPSLRENIACVSFPRRLLTQRFSICVQQAQTKPPPRPLQMMISSCSAMKRSPDRTPSLRHAQRVRVSPEPPLFALTLGTFCIKSLSLSLSLSDEPSHDSRNGRTSKQKNARTTLPAAEDAQQRDGPRPWIPALSSMCLLVQSAILAPAGSSSIVQPHAGCTVHFPPRGHQVAQPSLP